MTDVIFRKRNLGVGKRKRATARVFLIPGNGDIIINKISGNKYLQYNTTYLNNIWAPLEKLDLKQQFNIVAIVNGGGLTGQANAIQLGISRQLCQMDPTESQETELPPPSVHITLVGKFIVAAFGVWQYSRIVS